MEENESIEEEYSQLDTFDDEDQLACGYMYDWQGGIGGREYVSDS